MILVPTDFSEVCRNAANHGAEIASFLDYSVNLVHIINKETRNYLKKESLDFIDLEEKLEKESSALAEKHQVQAGYLAKEGRIFSAIAEIAEKAEDIDVERAEAAVAKAEERLERGGLPSEVEEAKVSLEKARLRKKIAEKHRNR